MTRAICLARRIRGAHRATARPRRAVPSDRWRLQRLCRRLSFVSGDPRPAELPRRDDCAESAAMLAELERRAMNGIGGELFVDWPGGPGWIDRHVDRAQGDRRHQRAGGLHARRPRRPGADRDRGSQRRPARGPSSRDARGHRPRRRAGLVASSPKAPSARRTTSSNSPPARGSATAGVPRSSRTIVRFDHSELQRDAAFVRASVEHGRRTPAPACLCGFNEMPPETRRRRSSTMPPGSPLPGGRAGLAMVHVELGDFPGPALRDKTIERLLPAATSVGMSLSELADLTGEGEPPEAAAIRLAEAYGLERVCVHADEWAFAVTRGDVERELEALEDGLPAGLGARRQRLFRGSRSAAGQRATLHPADCRPPCGPVAGRSRAVRPRISRSQPRRSGWATHSSRERFSCSAGRRRQARSSSSRRKTLAGSP